MALPSSVVVTEATIQSLTGGTSSGSPAAISRDGEWTIAVISNSDGNHGWAQLPSGCGVGDMVEVYWLFNALAGVLPPSSESFVDGSAHEGVPAMFRKIATDVWSIIT